ncbi:MAG: hypothetical protein IJA13_05135, partial [Clostridia bacterium]|nr:hypothetical protein [Clostridia bacterium]
MSNFKLSWRVHPWTFTKEESWESFLKLIDKHNDVADQVDLYISDDIFPNLSPLDDKRKQMEIFKNHSKQLRQRGCSVGMIVWPTFNLYAVERAYFPNMR